MNWIPGLLMLVLCCISNADTVESIYLQRALSFEATSQARPELLLRFERDIDGDGSNEIFLSKSSLRDGKQGFLWTIYAAGAAPDQPVEIGSTTFPDNMMVTAPAPDASGTHGFYTFGPSGGGRGTLLFFALANGKLENTTSYEVNLLEKDAAPTKLFSDLFTEQLKKDNPLNVTRTAIDAAAVEPANIALPTAGKALPRDAVSPGSQSSPIRLPATTAPPLVTGGVTGHQGEEVVLPGTDDVTANSLASTYPDTLCLIIGLVFLLGVGGFALWRGWLGGRKSP